MTEPVASEDLNPHEGRQLFRPELRSVEPTGEEAADSVDFDTCVFALARRLVERDEEHAHLAPNIPPPVLAAALQSYLDVQPDEVLLALVGVGKQGHARLGCALTTRRIYWPGADWNSATAGPPRCQSLAYALLPENMAGMGTGLIDLGDGRKFGTTGSSGLRTAILEFLGEARAMARGEVIDRPISAQEKQNARLVWPRVAAASRSAGSLQTDFRQFESRMMQASRAIVTPAIVLACVLVYVAMVAMGVPWMNPTGEQVLPWGADSGELVIIDHQYWRLFTSVFIHFGLIHIFMNMFCLVSAGPLVERLFGHFGFAVLYVLSGLGGSIASVWSQPTGIGAGASGAIFGVFGGLLGFLAIRHREVPLSILKPMRAGAISFVVYNTFFSAVIPGISMAAHTGGLATGFVCGLLMTAVSPADARAASGMAPALLRAGMGGLVAAGLVVLGYTGLETGRNRITADPARAINELTVATVPVFSELNRIDQEIGRLISGAEPGLEIKPKVTEAIRRLKSDGDSLAGRIHALPAANLELVAIRDQLVSAQSFQQKKLASFEQFLATGDQSHLDGPTGYDASERECIKQIENIASLRDAYMKAHDLRAGPGEERTRP
jgi:rhomboid protease GluP